MYVFFSDKFLVQLFSKPQHNVASNTNNAPHEKVNEEISSNDNAKLDNVIRLIAIHIFLDMTSLKINNAINDVHAPQYDHSRLPAHPHGVQGCRR